MSVGRPSASASVQIRINATLALAAPRARSVYGTAFPSVWKHLLDFAAQKMAAHDAVAAAETTRAAEGFGLSAIAAAYVDSSQLAKCVPLWLLWLLRFLRFLWLLSVVWLLSLLLLLPQLL